MLPSLLPFNSLLWKGLLGKRQGKSREKRARTPRAYKPGFSFWSAEPTPQQLELGPAKSERGGFSRYCGCAAAEASLTGTKRNHPEGGSLRPALLCPLHSNLVFPSGHSGYLFPEVLGIRRFHFHSLRNWESPAGGLKDKSTAEARKT